MTIAEATPDFEEGMDRADRDESGAVASIGGGGSQRVRIGIVVRNNQHPTLGGQRFTEFLQSFLGLIEMRFVHIYETRLIRWKMSFRNRSSMSPTYSAGSIRSSLKSGVKSIATLSAAPW